jgi:hypothetical protein
LNSQIYFNNPLTDNKKFILNTRKISCKSGIKKGEIMRIFTGILCISMLLMVIGCGDDDPTGSDNQTPGSITIHVDKGNAYIDTVHATAAASPSPKIKWQITDSMQNYIDSAGSIATPELVELGIIVSDTGIDLRYIDTIWHAKITSGDYFDATQTYGVTFGSASGVDEVTVPNTIGLKSGKDYWVKITYTIRFGASTPLTLGKGLGMLEIK